MGSSGRFANPALKSSFMLDRGSSLGDGWRVAAALMVVAALLCGLALISASGGPARAALQGSGSSAVLPCKRDLALTAVYRVDGLIRFEGGADRSLAGKIVRILDYKSRAGVAVARVSDDGTWWANSRLEGSRYNWLSKFVARSGTETTRWRRLGQAVAIRGREPGGTQGRGTRSGSSGHTRIKLKVSGDSPENLLVGVQTGCSRREVVTTFETRTNPVGAASIILPRPAVGEPFAIYRVRTDDGARISPPIVVKPESGN